MIHLSTSYTDGTHAYMFFCVAAMVVIIVGAAMVARKGKYEIRELLFIVCAGTLSAIIGSKLALFDGTQWISLWTGQLAEEHGKSMTGAIIGVMIGAWAAERILHKKESILDLIAVSFPLGMAVQRIGCLFAGCCHGSITTMPWGITYEPGSSVFIEQQKLGLIQPNAIHSMAVHPDQMYCILACIIIAIVAWRTKSKWKSPSGNFMCSIILYLSFRFLEDFLRFKIYPDMWMGITVEQWRILSIVFILSILLFFRERKYSSNAQIRSGQGMFDSMGFLKIPFFSSLILCLTIYVGSWLTVDERVMMLVTVIPFSVFLIGEVLIRTLFSQKLIRASSLLICGLVMMSQKADVPGDTPDSYTTFGINSALGKFNSTHDFNYHREFDPGCPPDIPGKWVDVTDKVNYKHTYVTGGLGIGRKIFYNQWRSLFTSLNVYAGSEKETPIQMATDSFSAPAYNNTLWSINPMIQYDTRGIGFGLGASIGMLGHDRPDDPDDHSDYNPKNDARKFALQTRLRLFSERFSFIEVLGGYDLGSTGDYNWQLLYGTRFNSQRYKLKTGFGWSKHGGKSFVLTGQVRLAPRLYLTPGFMFRTDNNLAGPDNKLGSRTTLGIEYRINDK